MPERVESLGGVRIETLKEKLKQLKTRQVALKDKAKARADKVERKEDTRRRILIGAIILAQKLARDGTLPLRISIF